MSRRSFRALTSLALAGLLVTCPVTGQEQVPPPGVAVGPDPNSLSGKEPGEGVYVRDSALALEKLALAERMERLKEWNKSADLFQEVIEKYPDRVVPSRTGEDDKIVQYTSVTRRVMERLARWPQEGLDVYRARFEAVAQGLIESAAGPGPSVAEMHKVFHRYFVTETAKKTGLRLIDLNVERGEFQAAARLADELLKWHPSLDDVRPAVLYRAALAHRLAGDEAKAGERLAAIQKDHADAVGSVRGQEVRLGESLAEELQGITALAAAAAPGDSWMTFGGDASRGRVPAAAGRPGARLFNVALASPQLPRRPPERQQIEQAPPADVSAGMTLGVFPVVDRGELFFQDGARIYARSIESGVALPGWHQTYPGDRDGQYVLPNVVGAPRTHQLTLTLTESDVIGVMGQADRTLINAGVVPIAEPRLVCLDRATGRENWLVALSGIELPADMPDDQQKSIRTLQMNGTPLVVGDSVLVAARGVKQAQFEDCWVLCFDLASGDYRWSCYIASSSTVGAPWGMQVQGLENTAQLAYANGRVYVLSNLGALAALDAYAGTIVWLNIYDRGLMSSPNFNPFGNMGRNRPEQQAPTKPWAYNPVIVKDGHVFILPTEGNHLYIYDANTGVEVKRIRRDLYPGLLAVKDSKEVKDTDMLLGVVGDQVIIASTYRAFSIDWRAHDPEKPAASRTWASGPFADSMRGRPFITADSLFVPTATKMLRYRTSDGMAMDIYPKPPREWDEKEEGPGNVLVTSSHVVIAGAGAVYGFTDLAMARARLDKQVAAAPQDTGPRLAYAEIMFAAGEPATAGAKLDEAVKLLGGPGPAMRAGPARDRVFNLALTFAQKLAADGEAESAKLVDAMYDRAAAAAAQPQQQVHYRLSRARHAERLKDAPSAAALYQQILADPQLRPVPLLDQANGGPTQAAAVAEEAIRNLVAKAGAAVYAPFEQVAAKDFEAARAAAADTGAPDPQRLLAVAESYPNSKVAPQALLAAADAYEAAGSPRPAVHLLRQMYFKYPRRPERARVIESMARNYLALPNRVDTAAARLAMGATVAGEHRLSKPLQLPDGRQIDPGATFEQALSEVRKYRSEAASKHLPDFGLPVPPNYADPDFKKNPRWPLQPAGAEQVIDGVAALALPLRDFARPDRVVAWSAADAAAGTPARLTIYAPGGAEPLGVSEALAEAPMGSAWVAEGVIVWDAASVVLLPEGGGDPTWRIELKDLPSVEVVRAGDLPGGDDSVPGVALPPGRIPDLAGNRLALRNRRNPIMQDGRMRRFPPPVQLARPDPAAAEQVAEVMPVGDRLLVTTSHGRILSSELAGGGRVGWQTRLTDRPFDRLVANEDFTVAKVSDEAAVRLIVMDTVTGQIRGVQSFPAQQPQVPCNVALSADGTLVYTLPDRLVLRDLYKPWGEPVKEVTGPTPSQPPYVNATGPHQLVIAEGRILALAEAGGNVAASAKKYVRVHSLETGQPLTLRVPDGEQLVDVQLMADTDSWDVSLRVIGPRLYIVNPHRVLCYNLDRPEEFWRGTVDEDPENYPNVREAMFGQKHVVLLSQPGVPQPREGEYQLLTFGRYPSRPGETAESGRGDYIISVSENAPATHWQGVNGGFYYVSDGKLHFLTAAKSG